MKANIEEPIPVSASLGFLLRGLKRRNCCLKILIKAGSLLWVSTVLMYYKMVRESRAPSQQHVTSVSF